METACRAERLHVKEPSDGQSRQRQAQSMSHNKGGASAAPIVAAASASDVTEVWLGDSGRGMIIFVHADVAPYMYCARADKTLHLFSASGACRAQKARALDTPGFGACWFAVLRNGLILCSVVGWAALCARGWLLFLCGLKRVGNTNSQY